MFDILEKKEMLIVIFFIEIFFFEIYEVWMFGIVF